MPCFSLEMLGFAFLINRAVFFGGGFLYSDLDDCLGRGDVSSSRYFWWIPEIFAGFIYRLRVAISEYACEGHSDYSWYCVEYGLVHS